MVRPRRDVRNLVGPKEAGRARPHSSLVDVDLAPAAREAADVTAMSLIPPVGRRAVAVFLGSEGYEKVERTYGLVMARLMLECVGGFVHARGGQIALAVRLEDRGDAMINPVQGAVTVDGKIRQFLRWGYLFLHFPRERVVVSGQPCTWAPGEQESLAVRAVGGAAAFWEAWRQYTREHNYLRGRAFCPDGRLVERDRTYTWDDILLPARTKKLIQAHVEGFLRNRARLRALGVKARRGLLLAGAPGTGKTLLGKVLADTLDTSFLWVTPRHIKDPTSFDEIMSLARFMAPVLVFLEDLDLYAEERESNHWMGLGELMNQLDGAADNDGIVTIATTNRLDVIERALRNRPGRFDRVVAFGEMDNPSRRLMLQRRLCNAAVSPDDLDYLVEATGEYTPAQIEELANTLYLLALGEENACPCGQPDAAAAGSGSLNGGPPDPSAGPITITTRLIDAALADGNFQREGRLGFHVA